MPELTHADLRGLPHVLREAILTAPLPPLGDPSKCRNSRETPHNALFDRLRSKGCGLPSAPPQDADAARACEAALWLLAGDLHRSHEVSQSLETADGSFWHGVMHRREGDFENAKYWFRRVGPHPAYPKLASAIAAAPIAGGVESGEGDAKSEGRTWDAIAFVDRCQQSVRREGEPQQQCVWAQWIEWQIMFEHCLRLAWPVAQAV